jgi:aspartyl-tRNA(Asn)/glutamyl-tRNA(Gln) amidotransferase subunit A
MSIIHLSAAELSVKLAAGEVSSVEATQAHLDRIAAVDGDVHAFLHVNSEALATAAAVDARRAAGEQLGELAGVPIAIKDVLCTIGMPSTAGSKILEGWIPPYDATVVARLRAANLIPLGKTNMDEFAMGSSTEHSAYGPTHNPWDLERIPGGSGGGSAAAVAAFEAPIALGSDTGGSIRQPAAVTGSVGVKPTYGSVSRYGAIALASSLDQVGPVSRTVLDSALVHDIIGGHDPRDSTSLKDTWPSFAEAAREGARAESLKGLRVGVVKELDAPGFQDGVKQRFHESLAMMEAAGAEIVEVSAPNLPDPPRGGVEQPGPLRLRALRPAGQPRRRRHRRRRDERDPRRRLRPRGQASHHPRHLCAERRVLRRVLRQRPEGAHTDPA